MKSFVVVIALTPIVASMAPSLSATPLTYSGRRGGRDLVVFCFAKLEDPDRLCRALLRGPVA
jgi:hypothetical protein